MQWIAILLLSVGFCVAYGIVHDQITARICVEYFTIGHPPVFGTNDPTLLGLGWGVIASWWVGVLLGAPLATISRIGSRPKRTAISLMRPMSILLVGVGALATLAGGVGYFCAVNGWVWLVGPMRVAVPDDVQVYFLTDLWIHNASYAGGFLGGLFLMVWVWRSRIQAAQLSEN